MGDQNSQQFSPRTIPQPDAPDVEKKGDVYAAESELQKACVEIENDADQLLDQLSPILRPDSDVEVAGPAPSDPDRCELAALIRRSAERIRALDGRITNVLSRIEI